MPKRPHTTAHLTCQSSPPHPQADHQPQVRSGSFVHSFISSDQQWQSALSVCVCVCVCTWSNSRYIFTPMFSVSSSHSSPSWRSSSSLRAASNSSSPKRSDMFTWWRSERNPRVRAYSEWAVPLAEWAVPLAVGITDWLFISIYIM